MALKLFISTVTLMFCLNAKNILCDSARNRSEIASNVSLQSYVSDLQTAAASAQYTANMTLRLVQNLQERLSRGELKYQCDKSNPKNSQSSDTPYIVTRIYQMPKTWNGARRYCEREGGMLLRVPITNEPNKEPVINFKMLEPIKGAKESETGAAFVGFHNLFDNEDWVSITGETLPFRHIPYSANGRCGAINYLAMVTNVDCNEPRRFFCEFPIFKN